MTYFQIYCDACTMPIFVIYHDLSFVIFEAVERVVTTKSRSGQNFSCSTVLLIVLALPG